MGTKVTCQDVETGESESAVITDDHLIITDGRAYLASVVAYANGTQILTVKKAASVDEARATPTNVTRHFGAADIEALR